MSSETKDPQDPTEGGVIINPLEIVSSDGEVSLRRYAPQDAEAAFDLIDNNREHLSQFGEDTPAKYPTLESLRESILHPRNPNRFRFGLRNRAGILVGTINLTPDESDPQKGEIGYYLGAQFQGHGYMSRAVEAITDYAFKNLGYTSLFGSVAPENTDSIRVLEKNAYTRSGVGPKGKVILAKVKHA